MERSYEFRQSITKLNYLGNTKTQQKTLSTCMRQLKFQIN